MEGYMKNFFACLSSILFISTLFFSCATTLQEDVMFSSELSEQVFESIYEYEIAFMNFDSQITQGNSVPAAELNSFENSVNAELKKSYLEPAARARLSAFLGLTALFRNNKKQAENYYSAGKSNLSGDEYVIILGIRLENLGNKEEIRLAKIDEFLEKDSKNGILLLEKGKILYETGVFNNAVATFDSAFLILDSEEKEINKYREIYSDLRDKAWTFYSSGIDEESLSSIITSDYLTKEVMVQLTVENSSLLEDFMGGTKMSTKDLMTKMVVAGFFSSPLDSENQNNTANDILSSKAMNRTMCARYLWNLYVAKKGKKTLLTRYSKRYSQMEDAASPIQDVEITNPDFDAVMGVVETEIMSLPDGINFLPEDFVTPVEFISYLKALEK